MGDAVIDRQDIRRTPRAVIEWTDSTAEDSWIRPESLPKRQAAVVIMTIGYVVRETAKEITIAHSVSTSGRACGVITIPKACIVRRRAAK